MTPHAPSRRTVRVAMHAHSEWSYDAEWPLEKIAKVMPLLGADVVMMSEHDTGFPADRFDAYREACATASTFRCLLIPGIEYSDERNTVHLPTWGARRFLGASRPTQELLRDAVEIGAVSILAHPARRAVWSLYDPDWQPFLSGLEIWNRKTDGLAPGKDALDLLRTTGLTPVVGMDFHRANHLWPLLNQVEIEGDLCEDTVVAALRRGDVSPLAFGRPLIGSHGEIRQNTHRRAESLRRFTKRHLLRR